MLGTIASFSHLQFSFFFFVRSREIEECTLCQCDFLKVDKDYNDLRFPGICGRYSPNSEEYLLYLEGRAPSDIETPRPPERSVYIRFVSDDTVNYKGFNLSFIVISDSRK